MSPREASALMQRGIALLDASTPASLAVAVASFDRAIDLRRSALAVGDPRAAYLLAASWMNRGDALTRLGGASRLLEALRSYDEALAVLRAVPPEADPLYRRRHAIAWINRGLTLHEQGAPGSIAEAIRSFEHGIAGIRAHPEHGMLLACAWVNHGNALLRAEPVRAVAAHGSAAAALALVRDIEAQDSLAAETSLKAQLIVCQAAAELLADPPDAEASLHLVCAATDAVEAGLRLVRVWEGRDVGRFGPLWRSLFRFGIAVYRRHQPRFLPEFILENLRAEAGRELHDAATAALIGQARQLPPDGFASLNTPQFDRVLAALRALRLTKHNPGT